MKASELQAHLKSEGASDQTIKLFFQYHMENPRIWKNFERVALREIQAGKQRVGAKAIIEEMRKEHELEKRNGEFKINNTYAPYYARMFIVKYTIYANLIETRQIKGIKEAA